MTSYCFAQSLLPYMVPATTSLHTICRAVWNMTAHHQPVCFAQHIGCVQHAVTSTYAVWSRRVQIATFAEQPESCQSGSAVTLHLTARPSSTAGMSISSKHESQCCFFLSVGLSQADINVRKLSILRLLNRTLYNAVQISCLLVDLCMHIAVACIPGFSCEFASSHVSSLQM